MTIWFNFEKPEILMKYDMNTIYLIGYSIKWWVVYNLVVCDLHDIFSTQADQLEGPLDWLQALNATVQAGECFGAFSKGPLFRYKIPKTFSSWNFKMMEHRSDDFPWKRVVFFAPDIRYQPFEMYPWSWGHEKFHKHIHFDDMFESHVWSHFGIRNLQVLPTSQAIYYIYMLSVWSFLL